MPTNGFVYVFLRADGLRKLGWTRRLGRRRSVLSRVKGINHTIEMTWEMGDCSAFQVEQTAHWALRAHRMAIDIEVYALPLAELISAVEAATSLVGTDLFFPERSRAPKREFLHNSPEWPAILAAAGAELEANPALFEAIMASQAAVRARLGEIE